MKHGLYANHFTKEEQGWLRRMAPDDLRPEIHMMRKAVKNVFEIQIRIRALLDSLPSSNEPKDFEALAKITNSLALAMTALNTTARTQGLFRGTDAGLNDPLDEALEHVRACRDCVPDGEAVGLANRRRDRTIS